MTRIENKDKRLILQLYVNETVEKILYALMYNTGTLLANVSMNNDKLNYH